METYKMYVSVTNQRVYIYPDDSPWEYEVDVTREYVPVFQNLFEQSNELENMNFFRSHFPSYRIILVVLTRKSNCERKKCMHLSMNSLTMNHKKLLNRCRIFVELIFIVRYNWTKGWDSI